MKKIIKAIILFVSLNSFCLLEINKGGLFAQPVNWLWAHATGGINYDAGLSITTDASGNVYTTGVFESSFVIFGLDTLFSSSTGYADMFLVKYDPAGNELWAYSAQGGRYEYGNSVAADIYGNIYVTGFFYSDSVIFGNFTLHNNSLLKDIFLVKFDSSGNVLWAVSSGGSDSDESNGVSTDGDGNVYIGGSFRSSSITFGTTVLSNANPGYDNIFIAKYDSSGNALWARSSGGNYYDNGESVVADYNGNVYICGYFSSSSISFGTTVLTCLGGNDIFIAKYDSSGNVLWAKSEGSGNQDRGHSVTTDAAGNVYLTGAYSATVIFGTDTLTSIAFSADIFIAKYNPLGNVIWAKSGEGNSAEDSFSAATDINGNVYITGVFLSDTMTFGTTIILNDSAGVGDIFIAKYDSSGNLVWAQSEGGTDADYGFGITAHGSADIYITGYFESVPFILGTSTFNSAGWADIFIAKPGEITSVPEHDIKNKMNIFPNPSTDFITIKSEEFDNSFINIRLFDLFGRLIFLSEGRITHPASGIKIDLELIEAGVYTLQVNSGKSVYCAKILKQ